MVRQFLESNHLERPNLERVKVYAGIRYPVGLDPPRISSKKYL